jgi:hypothetical protein
VPFFGLQKRLNLTLELNILYDGKEVLPPFLAEEGAVTKTNDYIDL